MSARSFSAGYAAIDGAERPAELLAFLDEVAAIGAVTAAKEAATALMQLRPGHRVLDVGCGTGFDLPAMAAEVGSSGYVIGVDVSSRAVEEARRRSEGLETVMVDVADIVDLPYADESFEACRADRTLQHISDPERALAEIYRVLAPGGRLVVLEQRTRLEAEPELKDDPVAVAVDRRFSTPDERRSWLGHLLPLLLHRAGFTELSVDRTLRRSGDFHIIDTSLRISEHVAELVAAGATGADEGRAWLHRLQDAAGDGRLTIRFEALTFVGQRP